MLQLMGVAKSQIRLSILATQQQRQKVDRRLQQRAGVTAEELGLLSEVIQKCSELAVVMVE